MTLIIADNIDDRLDFRGYLRKNGILAAAPPPSDFEAAVMSGKSEVIIFICPFRPSLAAVAPPDKICIAVGTGASSNNSYMLGFDDPFDPELLEFLKDIEEKAVRQRVGELVRRDGKLYCAARRAAAILPQSALTRSFPAATAVNAATSPRSSRA